MSKKLGEIEQMEIHIREIQKQIRKPFDGDLPSLLRKIDQFELTLTQKAEALNNVSSAHFKLGTVSNSSVCFVYC